jgi:gamma-glutamylcyclotransferase (GGCT)/AIG2-like uncharacterized protein YtfP
MTTMSFFVYGSLSEGMVHFNKIKDFIESSEAATTLGTAYRLKVGFPVVLLTGSDTIGGFLVQLRVTDLLVNLLDEFFGFNKLDESKSLYFRREIAVEVQGQVQKAWAYVLNPSKLPKSAVRIEGGNWQDSLAKEPALTDTLTERQKHYIKKLGSSTGREIVPIDLPLYRELMNLEMIVDKGRRLALSKLGNEVYRHLA